MKTPKSNRPGYRLVYTRKIRHKSGKILLADKYGIKAFAIWVKE